MDLVQRPLYLNFLKRHRGKQLIKVISGIRRCGKSTLLSLYKDFLIGEGVKSKNIIAINFEDLEYEDLHDYHALYQYVKNNLQDSGTNYIFLDEIQHVRNFERAVDSLFIKDNTDVYITGSNAYFMSGELATLLSGRYVELRMQPLSFKEYCVGTNLAQNHSLAQIYERYLTDSSFPYTLQISGKGEDIKEYLSGIYNSVILKDVVGRLHVSDVKMLESVIKYIFSNVGSLLSIRNIANSMRTFGRSIDSKTVEKYLSGLLGSLLIYEADRFDIKGKEILKLNPKYYVADAALRYLVIGRHGQDTGHILENTVYLELLRRGYEVYVGAFRDGEVDFVAKNHQGLSYYQVAVSTSDGTVLKRELNPLLAIKDNYPKYLLTLDEINATADYGGIMKLNALEWLLQ